MRNNLQMKYRKRLTDPRYKEGIREPLYDFQTYDSGVTTSLKFFQTQVGGTKTKADTNMPLNGQLPQGQKFVAEAISIHVLPGSNAASYVRQDPVRAQTAATAPSFANDVWALVHKGWLELTIGTKPYLTAPLLDFPPPTGLGITPAAAVENTNTTVLNLVTVDYARLIGRPFMFDPEVPIEGLTNFDVTLAWDAAVTLPSGFDARIGVELHGVRFRN